MWFLCSKPQERTQSKILSVFSETCSIISYRCEDFCFFFPRQLKKEKRWNRKAIYSEVQLNGSSTVAQNCKSDVLECCFHLFSSLFSWRLLEHISRRSQGQAAVFQFFINAIIKRLIFSQFNSFKLTSRGVTKKKAKAVKIKFLIFLITSAFFYRAGSERSVLRGPLMHFVCLLTAAVASLLRRGWEESGLQSEPGMRPSGVAGSLLSRLCADRSTFVTSVYASVLLSATQPQRLRACYAILLSNAATHRICLNSCTETLQMSDVAFVP